jgi:hypothetical protein
MNEKTVLFVGGPLHGKLIKTYGAYFSAFERSEIDFNFTNVFREPKCVTYAISKFVVLGRVIRIGHLGPETDESLIFEVLMSDKAKKASEPIER